MTSFKLKKIESENELGTVLKNARKNLGVELNTASKYTGICLEYLEAIEKGNYDSLPGDVYVKCFIKKYGQYLEIDCDKILGLYCRERKIFKNIKNCEPEAKTPLKIVSRLNFLVMPKIARNLAIFFILFFCLAYLGFKVEAIIRPPELKVLVPDNDISTSERVIEIYGKTVPESVLTINNEKTLVGEDGKFLALIDLQPGVNIVKITAKKDHSKENIVYRRIVVIDDDSESEE